MTLNSTQFYSIVSIILFLLVVGMTGSVLGIVSYFKTRKLSKAIAALRATMEPPA